MSYVSDQGVLNAQFNTEIIRCLPHVLMRPTLVQDGNAWLAIYGDLPTGVVGTGSTPAEAMADFDAAWTRPAVSPPGYGREAPSTPDMEEVSHG